MSENLEQSNIIKKFQDELDRIDQKYPEDTDIDNCAKCFEKLSAYTRFTMDLIDSGRHYHFHDHPKMVSDETVSIKLEETKAKIQLDLNVVRDSLGNQEEIEKQANDSILEVESLLDDVLKDYYRVIEANQHLNEELSSCSAVVRANYDVIALLEDENEKLKEGKLSENDIEKDDISDDQNDDCRVKIEEIQQQLSDRDKSIEHLLKEIDRLTVEASSHESENNEYDHASNASNESSSNSYSTNLLGESQKLRNTILKSLDNIATDIVSMSKTKENQLLEQQAKIDELSKQLESRLEPSINGTDEESESICRTKLEEMKAIQQILAQQADMLEDEFSILKDDHKNLMEINTDLIKSISICQSELSKYNFE